jgi:GTP-binding protein HflX
MQLETDRRLMGRRIAQLKSELQKIEQVRETQSRNRQDVFRIALVGYTNAGKSTLLRSLTGADVLVEDRLFATLDATTRSLQLDSNKHVTITDTVGFIRKLPHDLVASFRSTLSEAKQADCILHVIDSSHPSAADHIAEVRKVLGDLEIDQSETLLVMNKSDQVDHEAVAKRLADGEAFVSVSALTGVGIDEFKDRLRSLIELQMVEVQMRIPQTEGKLISAIHEFGEVLSTRYEGNDVLMTACLRKDDAGKIHGLSQYAPALFA